MDDGKLLKFIYFNSFMISVNLLDQIVTDISFEKLSSLEMGH